MQFTLLCSHDSNMAVHTWWLLDVGGGISDKPRTFGAKSCSCYRSVSGRLCRRQLPIVSQEDLLISPQSSHHCCASDSLHCLACRLQVLLVRL